MKRFCRGPLVAFFVLSLSVPMVAAAQSSSPSSGMAGVPVTLAPVARQDVPVLLRNIGTVQALQSALIRSRVDGTLESVAFAEGQDVRRGDVLAQIDPRPYQAAYDQARAKKAADEAQLANARRDLARYTQLATRDFASRQQLDTQAATVAQLEASLKGDDANIAAAKVNLDYCTIRAPFDGRMGLRQIDPGNVVRAADTTGVGIVTINQIHPITATFTLPQDTLPGIQAAMARGSLPVQAFTADNTTLLATGTLMTTDNAIDASTGTIRLKASFPNQENRLWPGQFVNVQLQTGVLRQVATVPSIAVQRSQNGLYVYLARPDQTVAFTPVTVGQDDGQTAVVTSGLEPGAEVVVNGMSRLSNGLRIAPRPAPKAATAPAG